MAAEIHPPEELRTDAHRRAINESTLESTSAFWPRPSITAGGSVAGATIVDAAALRYTNNIAGTKDRADQPLSGNGSDSLLRYARSFAAQEQQNSSLRNIAH
jgi:hypothetical protein